MDEPPDVYEETVLPSEIDGRRGSRQQHEADLVLAYGGLEPRCALWGPSHFPPTEMPESDDDENPDEADADELIDLTRQCKF